MCVVVAGVVRCVRLFAVADRAAVRVGHGEGPEQVELTPRVALEGQAPVAVATHVRHLHESGQRRVVPHRVGRRDVARDDVKLV